MLPLACGKGALELKLELATTYASGIPVLSKHFGAFCLSVVRQYKHMGSKTLASGAIMPEVIARHHSAKQAMQPLRSKFFQATRVEFADKFNLGASIMLSRGVYGSSGWPIPTVAEKKRPSKPSSQQCCYICR